MWLSVLVHEPLEPSYKQINDIEYDQQRHSMQHTTLGHNSFAAAGRGYVEPMLLHWASSRKMPCKHTRNVHTPCESCKVYLWSCILINTDQIAGVSEDYAMSPRYHCVSFGGERGCSITWTYQTVFTPTSGPSTAASFDVVWLARPSHLTARGEKGKGRSSGCGHMYGSARGCQILQYKINRTARFVQK